MKKKHINSNLRNYSDKLHANKSNIESREVKDFKINECNIKLMKEFYELFIMNNKGSESIFIKMFLSDATSFVLGIEFININAQFNYYSYYNGLFDILIFNKNIQSHVFEILKLLNFDNKITEDLNIKKIKMILDSIVNLNPSIVESFYLNVSNLANYIIKPKTLYEKIELENNSISNIFDNIETRYTVHDLLMIDSTRTKKEIYEEILSNTIIQSNIVKLFFECIKSKDNFNEILQYNIKCTKPEFLINFNNTFNFIYDYSDDSLKILLFLICSKFCAIPFLTLNNSINFYPELIFLFARNDLKPILSISLSEDISNYPKGKSYLMNNCFKTSFIEDDQFYSKFGVIECQFDSFFNNSLGLFFLDFHGKCEYNIFINLMEFLSVIIIHIYESEYIKFENDLIKLIESNSSKGFILILHSSTYNQEIKIEKETLNFIKLKIKPLRDFNQIELNILNNVIWDFTKKHEYVTNPIEKYILLLNNFKADISEYYQKIKNVEKLIEYIDLYRDDFTNEKLLPFYSYFVKLCKLENKLKIEEEKYNNDIEIKEINKELDSIKKLYESQNINEVTKIFELICHDNCFLGNLYYFSTKLKLKIDFNLKDLYSKQKQQLTKMTEADSPENKIKEVDGLTSINDNIVKQSFCYEFIVRELYHIYINNIDKPNFIREAGIYKYFVNQLISTGNPFEIIDGDNLKFILKTYSNIFQEDKSSIIVVSVVGLQSSGKSTLLNFLFGTQFACSASRCTKGVYGAIMKFKYGNTYKKLLILDTEGIQSAEREDKSFDKRLFLFCLSVSNITIVCNKGDLHNSTLDLLELVIKTLDQIKETRVNNTEVFIVLNALTDTKEDKLWEPISKLNVKLSNLKLKNDSVKFSMKNVKLLPFAFNNKKIKDDFEANIHKSEFSQICFELRNEILNIKNNNNSFGNLAEWFEYATTVWKKAEKINRLYNFDTLEEFENDEKLKDKVSKSIENFKVDVKDLKEDFYIKNVNFSTSHQFNINLNEGKNSISRDYEKLIEKHIKNFENDIGSLKINNKMLMNKTNLLYKDCSLIKQQTLMAFETEMNKLKVKHFSSQDYKINKVLNDLDEENKHVPYSEEEAKEKFQQFWAKEKEEITNSCNKNISKENDFIIETYKSYCNDLNKIDYDLKLKIKNILNEQGRSSLIELIQSIDVDNILKIKNFNSPKDFQISNLSKVKKDYFINNEEFLVKSETYVLEYAYISAGINSNNLICNLKKLFKISSDESNSFLFSNSYDEKSKSIFKNKLKNFVTDLNWDLNRYKLCIPYEDILNESEKIIEQIKKESKNENKDKDKLKDKEKDESKFKKELKNVGKSNNNSFNNQCSSFNKKRENNSNFNNNQMHNFEINSRYSGNINQGQIITKFCTKLETVIIDNIKRANQILSNDDQYTRTNVINHSEIYKLIHSKDKDGGNLTNNDKKVLLERKFVEKMNPNENLSDEVKKYIKWYIGDDDISLFSNAIKQFSNFIKNCLLFDNIIDSILKICLETLMFDSKDLDYFNELNILKEAIKNSLQLDNSRYRNIDLELIKCTVNNISNLIPSIEKDISDSHLELSSTFISKIHTIAMFVIHNFYIVYEEYISLESLRMHENKKNNQMNRFVFFLVKDTNNSDLVAAKCFVENYLKMLNEHIMNKSISEYNDIVESKKKNFEPHNSLEILDIIILKEDKSDDEIINIIMSPDKVLLSHFEKMWEDQFSFHISKIKSYFENFIITGLKNMNIFIQNMYDQLNQSYKLVPSLQIFDYNINSINANYNDISLKLDNLVFEYFHKSIFGNWNNTTLELGSTKIDTDLPKIDILNIDSKFKIEPDLLFQGIISKRIGNIKIFLEEVIKLLNDITINNSILIPEENKFDTNNLKSKYKSYFVGCSFYCKQCGKKCDVLHDEKNILHQCLRGHRFKAFLGSKFEGNNFPSFMSCDNMDGDKEIKFEGEIMQWKEFVKRQQKTWNFKSNPNLFHEIKDNNIKIWNKIGKVICKYYSSKNNKMIYKEYFEIPNVNTIEKTLLIYLLDSSGSMDGTPWNDLVLSVKASFKSIEKNSSLKDNMQCYVIVYENDVNQVIHIDNITENECNKIIFTSGGTDFGPPLQKAYEIISNNLNIFKKFNMIFMSDGQASYPKTEIEMFKSNQEIMNRTRFDFVLFGTSNSNLSQMSIDLGGCYNQALDFSSLSAKFIEIVNSIDLSNK